MSNVFLSNPGFELSVAVDVVCHMLDKSCTPDTAFQFVAKRRRIAQDVVKRAYLDNAKEARLRVGALMSDYHVEKLCQDAWNASAYSSDPDHIAACVSVDYGIGQARIKKVWLDRRKRPRATGDDPGASVKTAETPVAPPVDVTWCGIVELLITALEHGTEKGKRLAREQLRMMAKEADK